MPRPLFVLLACSLVNCKSSPPPAPASQLDVAATDGNTSTQDAGASTDQASPAPSHDASAAPKRTIPPALANKLDTDLVLWLSGEALSDNGCGTANSWPAINIWFENRKPIKAERTMLDSIGAYAAGVTYSTSNDTSPPLTRAQLEALLKLEGVTRVSRVGCSSIN